MKTMQKIYMSVLAASIAAASLPALADTFDVARGGNVPDLSPLQPVLMRAPNATLNQDFEGAFPPTNWLVRNQSAAIGTNTNCWNQFTGASPWAAHTGAAHAGANFNCTSGNNTISGWLISEQITSLQNGDTFSFWTRKASPDTYADRLEARLCLDSTPDSCGAAGSTGTGSAAVGDFTTVLVSVNPTLVTGVYPLVYTQFTVVLSGLPAGPNNGRVGFRYFVTSGGPGGSNSDILSIDDVAITAPAAAPPVFSYSPAPAATVAFTGGTTIGSSANGSIAVTVGTAGTGTGAGATTTTTCTAPTAPFAGFNQTVTAVGTDPISGSPLSGTCTLGAAVVTQTLTCSENQGGTSVARTFELSCPQGTAATLPLTSTPTTGGTVTNPTQQIGGPATIVPIAFQNSNATPVVVTCTAPAEPQFTVSPLVITVPANGSASTSVSYSSATAGTFPGSLTCTAGAQTFTFVLGGSTILGVARAVPAIDGDMRYLLMLGMMGVGLIALSFRRRA